MLALNQRRLNFIAKHPSVLANLMRRDANRRLAVAAEVHGLKDIRNGIFSKLLETPTLWTIAEMITLARKKVPYHDSAFLYYLVKALKPSIAVETGVWYGYSSCFILQALEELHSGHLYSVDLRAQDFPENLEVGFVVPDKLRSRWTLMLGPSVTKLSEALLLHAKIDLFIHDSDHSYENMMFEFQVAWPRLRLGGVLIADNVELNWAFDDFCSSVHQVGIKRRTLTSTHGAIIKGV